jgi:hypothetical protein
LTPLPLGDHDIQNENKREDDMAKAGLCALGFVLLFGGLIIGVGFVLSGAVHDQPEPLPALMSSELDTTDLTARFRLAYDVAIRRCDVCERCGKAPVSKALRINDPIEGAFDSSSNLLAVCNACYSAARGRWPCRA